MNYRRIFAGLFLTFIIGTFCGFSRIDDDIVTKIAAQLDKWLSTHPVEKVYLHMDKPCYSAGDNIWFKAYIVTGNNHRLSRISGVLNVELIDDRDSVKQSIKLPVTNGLSRGDFALPDTLMEGNYRIRAYTNWMRNAGDDYFFDKTIVIVNPISNNIFTKVDYTYTRQNGQQKTSAIINYVDLDGKPCADDRVSYEVRAGSKTIAKGTGQTDDKGNLHINFINTGGLQKQGHIITALALANKKMVRKSILIKAASDRTDVQFFPEGGNLVYGNDSKIAFKAVGSDGLGADIKGVILDSQNNQVCTFASTHLGMGMLSLNPVNGKTYKARITFADGSESMVDLPGAVNTGYSLSVDNAADNIHVKILPGLAVENTAQTEVMTLVAQSGGTIYYAGKSKSGSKYFTATIPKSKFPSGIVQFTLFSSTGEPMNERLVFIQNDDQLKVDAVAEKQTYASREKVRININARDASSKPVIGSFSIAVINETNVPVDEAAENTMPSNLLLTSDLKGYIEKPNYYFIAVNDQKQSDLDVLMLTQGYHRFEWKQVMDDSFPPLIYRPEKTLEISGHLKTLGGKPIVHGKVTLFSTTGGTFLIDTVSDNDGRFSFRNLIFTDSVKFLIQARTAKDRKNIQIDIDNIYPQKVGANKNAPDLQVNINSGLSPFLQSSKLQYAGQLKYGLVNHAIVLKEVVIKEKKNPAENSSNLNGPGNADQVVAADQLGSMGCGHIADCLQGVLFGVTFRNDTPYLARSLGRPMQIVLDGSYVGADILKDLNAADIQSVEVLRNIAYTSIYGGRGGSGVLVITSKHGGPGVNYQRYAPGVVTFMPKGYYKARTFYSPQYDDPKTNAQVPDLRSTVYWNPNIITGKDGKASFMYFNTDAKGTYRVVMEGIDNNGNLGRAVYRYKVE